MPSVEIIAPAGREVFIDGNYTPLFPQVVPYVFDVSAGPHTFETRRPDYTFDYRSTIAVGPNDPPRDLTLDPVP